MTVNSTIILIYMSHSDHQQKSTSKFNFKVLILLLTALHLTEKYVDDRWPKLYQFYILLHTYIQHRKFPPSILFI